MTQTAKFKVVLLGEGRVGKTSILLRYIKGEYQDRQVSTLQASYLDKKIAVDNHNVHLSVWDTAGQERFHALGPIYYRDADGALLVYDITDKQSFDKVKTWVRELRRIVGDDIQICIAGNKLDLQRNRQVEESEAVKYAKSVNATHFQTSAKLNKGLNETFVMLTQKMLAKKATQKKGNQLLADDDDGAVTSTQAPTSSRNPPNVRSGARGQTIQIVDDRESSGRSGRIQLGSTGSGQISNGKSKSNCC